MASYLQMLILAAAMLLLAGLQAGCAVSTSAGLDDDELTGQKEGGPKKAGAAPRRAAAVPPPVKQPAVSPKGGTLRLGLSGEPLTLDPAEAVDHEAIVVCENLFDTLVRYADGSTELEPGLAEGWESTKDELTWIFQLRENVKFHDGTPLTADAVAFSFHRQMDPTHPFHAGQALFWKRLMTAVSEVRVLDRRRVAIELSRPYAPLLAALAMPQASIVSPEAVKQQGTAGFARHPNGSGPFKFVDWSTGQSIVLTANTDYWGTKPNLAGAIVRVVPDPTARLLQLIRGDLDAMEGLSPTDRTLASKSGLDIQTMPGLNVIYLAFNTRPAAPQPETTSTTEEVMTTGAVGPTPPPIGLSALKARTQTGLRSPRIRKALARAINKSAICTEVFGGMAVPAVTPLPPTMWSCKSDLKDYTYDPVAGRLLLEQAGYAKNFQIELCTLDQTRSYLPNPRQLAFAVKMGLEKLGVEVRVRPMDFERFQETVEAGQHDACVMGWVGDLGDPDNFLYTLLDSNSAQPPHTTNYALFSSDLLHQKLLEGQGFSNRITREHAYRKAQEIVFAEAPMIPLVHLLDSLVTQPVVGGLRLHPVGLRRLVTASLNR